MIPIRLCSVRTVVLLLELHRRRSVYRNHPQLVISAMAQEDSDSPFWNRNAARRVSLAIQSSWKTVSQSRADLVGEENTIDEAMKSLYDPETPWSQRGKTQQESCSYRIHVERDWVLDEAAGEFMDESKALINDLEFGGDRMIADLETYVKRWESDTQDSTIEHHDESGKVVKDSSFDICVESASTSFTTITTGHDDRGMVPDITTCHSSSERTKTPVLVKAVDMILTGHNIRTDAENTVSPRTNDLVQMTDKIVARSKLKTPVSNHDIVGTKASQVAETASETWSDTMRVSNVDELPSFISLPANESDQGTQKVRDDLKDYSLFQSVYDLSSPEARFVRRRQQAFEQSRQPKSIDSMLGLHSDNDEQLSVEDIPDPFLTNPEHDDTLKLLEELPWQFVLPASSDTEVNLDMWDSFMTSQLCTFDGTLERLKRALLRKARPHREHLYKANASMYDLTENIKIAFRFHRRSQELLDKSRGSADDGTGIAGQDGCIRQYNTRDEIEKILEVVTQAGSVAKETDGAFAALKSLAYDSSIVASYSSIRKAVESSKRKLYAAGLAQLRFLNGRRHACEAFDSRALDRMVGLCDCFVIDASVSKVPKWNYYSEIISVFRQIDESDHHRWRKSLVDRLVVAFGCEAEKSVATALLNPSEAEEESQYNEELNRLACEVESGWGDGPKMRVLTHNLVTVRFDFEAHKRYLPRVVQALIGKLDFLLCFYDSLSSWHNDNCPGLRIQEHLVDSKQLFWSRCERTIDSCLLEFVNFSRRDILFTNTNGAVDDSRWSQNLADLVHVFSSLKRFHRLQHPFITSKELISEVSLEPFDDMVHRHVRSIHIESMNGLGRALAGETWALRTPNGLASEEDICMKLLSSSYLATKRVYSVKAQVVGNQDQTRAMLSRESTLNIETQEASMFVPSLVTDLVNWICRLILVSNEIPASLESTTPVLINLCDLYVTTVFRLCAGSRLNEKLLLGEHATESNLHQLHSLQDSLSETSGYSGRGQARQQREFEVPATSLIDAQICSPRPRDLDKLHVLRQFIIRAQDSLVSVVSLDKVDSWLDDPSDTINDEEWSACAARCFTKRLSASHSLNFVAQLMERTCDMIESPSVTLLEYVKSLRSITPLLMNVSERISAQRVIKGRGVVAKIVSGHVNWEECKISEDANAYIDELASQCGRVWTTIDLHGNLPHPLHARTWKHLVSAGYYALLEGFARVPSCSTEGRASMAIDVASYTACVSPAGIQDLLGSNIEVPAVDSSEVVHEVDVYIRAYYFPPDEMFSWIMTHFCDFTEMQMKALLTTSSQLRADDPDAIDRLHAVEDVYAKVFECLR